MMAALVPGGNSRPFTRRGPALLDAVFLGWLACALTDFAGRAFFKPWDGLAAFERAGVGRAVAGRVRFVCAFLGVAAFLPSPVSGATTLAFSPAAVCINLSIW
jgi:hypothetical protein